MFSPSQSALTFLQYLLVSLSPFQQYASLLISILHFRCCLLQGVFIELCCSFGEEHFLKQNFSWQKISFSQTKCWQVLLLPSSQAVYSGDLYSYLLTFPPQWNSHDSIVLVSLALWEVKIFKVILTHQSFCRGLCASECASSITVFDRNCLYLEIQLVLGAVGSEMISSLNVTLALGQLNTILARTHKLHLFQKYFYFEQNQATCFPSFPVFMLSYANRLLGLASCKNTVSQIQYVLSPQILPELH